MAATVYEREIYIANRVMCSPISFSRAVIRGKGEIWTRPFDSSLVYFVVIFGPSFNPIKILREYLERDGKVNSIFSHG